MKKVIRYDRFPREYTVVGVSVPFRAFFRPTLKKIYGGKTFKEIIVVIKNGQFFHLQQVGDRDQVAGYFINQVKKGKIDFNKSYKEFDKKVREYEKLVQTKEIKFSKQTLLDFYKYYEYFMPISYAGMEGMEAIDILPKSKRKRVEKWLTKIRKRAEKIYKFGETRFIPRYLRWLIKKYLPSYKLKELLMVTCYEMEGYLKRGVRLPTPEELKKRIRLFYIRFFGNDQIEQFSGNFAKSIIKKKELFKKEKIDSEKIKEFSGSVSYLGKVRGRVHIVRNKKEMKGFKKDDIIVSQMTEPYYISIMKLAKAFITDEGGVLCHAAIVARELKKPCIISTKIATKVLKDGDHIEVDAYKGIVKKI